MPKRFKHQSNFTAHAVHNKCNLPRKIIIDAHLSYPNIERNSEKDIESMIRDAEANQEADAKRKETVEAKNELDS